MKIRSGFVSNSSSSSFIVTGDEAPIVTIKVELPVDTVVSDKESLKDYFLKEYYCDEEDLEDPESHYGKRYITSLAALEAGKKVYLGRVSSEDYEGASMFLYGRGTLVGDGDAVANFEIVSDLDG